VKKNRTGGRYYSICFCVENPLHLDDEYASKSQYEKKIAHGIFILSKVAGLHYGIRGV